MADLNAGQYQPLIDASASKYGIDPAWLTHLLYQENRFQPQGTSPAGAQGMAQFMPGTAARYGVNVNDPASSIEGAAHYLSDNLKMFGGNQGLATAAYNWGEGNVQKWLRNGGSVPKETQQYVSNITGTPITTWAGAGGASSRQAFAPAPSAPLPAPGAQARPITPTPIQAPGPMDPTAQAGGPGAPLGTPGSTVNPPIPTTPGTTINSTPGSQIAGLGQFAGNLKKALGLPDDDKPQAKPDIKPLEAPPAPGARNVSPLLGNPQIYAQRMAGLGQPLTWGGGPPGQMYGAGYGPQNQPVYGTSLMSQLQMLSDPTWMNQMAGG